MRTDKPNLFDTLDTLGGHASRIVENLRAWPGKASAPHSPKQAPHHEGARRHEGGKSESFGPCLHHESEPRDDHGGDEQHDHDDEPDQEREVAAAGTEGDAFSDTHGAPEHVAMRAGLTAVFDAVRKSPRATKAEFKGWSGGRPPKPDSARTRRRRE